VAVPCECPEQEPFSTVEDVEPPFEQQDLDASPLQQDFSAGFEVVADAAVFWL
jgi:hypothetical protein